MVTYIWGLYDSSRWYQGDWWVHGFGLQAAFFQVKPTADSRAPTSAQGFAFCVRAMSNRRKILPPSTSLYINKNISQPFHIFLSDRIYKITKGRNWMREILF